uniref:Uncharacterized protein n=1 Tax=Rhizophora mucronata TaxID=61149 RepID=A0A2P2LRZ1_RHIMU
MMHLVLPTMNKTGRGCPIQVMTMTHSLSRKSLRLNLGGRLWSHLKQRRALVTEFFALSNIKLMLYHCDLLKILLCPIFDRNFLF